MPWRDIRDVGNFYRHRYDNVAESYVWRTVKDYLPPLLAVVLSEIAVLDAGASFTAAPAFRPTPKTSPEGSESQGGLG
jgi:hypothetical protein